MTVWKTSKSKPTTSALKTTTAGEYSWKECENFQMPENCVLFDRDDDGSEIYCGKALNDGQEVPAKIVPNKKECRIRCESGEKVVPTCRKVLICTRPNGDDWQRRRHHSHRQSDDDCCPRSESDWCRREDRCCRRRDDDCCRRRDEDCCRRRDDDCRRWSDDCCCRRDDDWCDSSSSESEGEDSSETKTTSNSTNESRVFIKNARCSSNSTTVVVKKNKRSKKHRRGSKGGKKCERECWNEERTRIVPKVTYEPKVRYEPKVTMEKKVRYQPETYVTRVCGERCRRSRCERRRCCEKRESCSKDCESIESYGSCEDVCRLDRSCSENLLCELPTQSNCAEEVRNIRPERCDSPPRSKGRCW